MSIIREFKYLQKLYDLQDVDCYHLPVREVKYFTEKQCMGLFVPSLNSIVMRSRRIYQLNLQCLLHEIGHAIQYKEGRFITNPKHKKKRYAMELEAEIFALTEYRKLYGNDFGEIDLNWHLGSYDLYFNNKQDISYVGRLKSIYKFIKELKGEDKKPILKLINKRDIAVEEKCHWEKAFRKIAM